MKSITLILALGILLTACGASKKALNTDSKNGSSRQLPGTLNDDGTVTNESGDVVGYFAHCNDFSNNSVQGIITTYFDPYTNAFVADVIRMELKSVPTTLTSGSDVYLQFFKWKEDVEGERVVVPQPVPLYVQFEDGTWLNQTPINSISKSQIETLISNNNLASRGVTVANFLSKVMVALTGLEVEYDAIMINTYDNSVGTSAQDSVNVLLPAFAADPNLYAQTHEATSLQMLHPNYDLRNSGYTEYQYYQETNKNCL